MINLASVVLDGKRGIDKPFKDIPTRKLKYTHPRVRSAYRSLKTKGLSNFA